MDMATEIRKLKADIAKIKAIVNKTPTKRIALKKESVAVKKEEPKKTGPIDYEAIIRRDDRLREEDLGLTDEFYTEAQKKKLFKPGQPPKEGTKAQFDSAVKRRNKFYVKRLKVISKERKIKSTEDLKKYLDSLSMKQLAKLIGKPS